jgi:hypothetical protein
MRQLIALGLFAVTVAAPAYGADRQSLTNWDPTGNDLVASCSATSEFESGACIGFIQGVINGFNSGTIVQRGRGNEQHSIFDLCVPTGVTNGQATKVILAYADKHPEQLHYPADIIVTKAIGAWYLMLRVPASFPCHLPAPRTRCFCRPRVRVMDEKTIRLSSRYSLESNCRKGHKLLLWHT